MKEKGVKANSLKIIMIILIFIIVGSAGFSFYYTLNNIRSLVIDTNTVLDKANASRQITSGVKTSADTTTENLIKITNSMLYQKDNIIDETTKDLQKYATESGITLNSVSPATAQGQNNLPTLFSKIKSTRISLSIGSPISFAKLIKFIKAIETNKPKMQITNLNLSNVHANAGDVTVEPINIEVYTR